MATVHVRDVPEDVYVRIRALARSEGRSLNAQVVRLLATTVTTSRSVEGALDAARKLRQTQKSRHGTSSLSLLHEARRSRERR